MSKDRKEETPKPLSFLFAMFQSGGNIPPILAAVKELTDRRHEVHVIAGPGLQANRPIRSSFVTIQVPK